MAVTLRKTSLGGALATLVDWERVNAQLASGGEENKTLLKTSVEKFGEAISDFSYASFSDLVLLGRSLASDPGETVLFFEKAVEWLKASPGRDKEESTRVGRELGTAAEKLRVTFKPPLRMPLIEFLDLVKKGNDAWADRNDWTSAKKSYEEALVVYKQNNLSFDDLPKVLSEAVDLLTQPK